MIKPVKIKDKTIGEGCSTLLIAEMACAHQGDIENACKMVELAVKAKTDAVQLQIFKKEVYMSPLYKDYDLITQLELSQDEWTRIIDLIQKENILLFCAVYDVESAQFLSDKGVNAFKVHSSDLSNPELLLEVAKLNKPIFLSCGASTMDEIRNAIEFIKKNGSQDIILMLGYQAFPTIVEDSNLKFMKTLEAEFGLNVGFYDHVDGGSELSKIIPIMSIGYGAKVIEKHFILTREKKGIDYESSLDHDNFIRFVQILRESEKAIGSTEIRNFTEGELNYRAYCKKSIIAKNNLPKGKKISREDVMFVRSEPGIPPNKFEEIRGKIAKRDISQYQNIIYEDF